jgi:site-specific DNA recombinase
MTMHVRAPNVAPRPEESVRACAYLRVSTGRQAESDLSIPDQRRQIARFCSAKAWTPEAEYVEPGASATDDNRPAFQRMIERACDDDRPFDVIVVHSFSRFFRDAFGLEMYVRRLAKAGVRLVSITQELGDDPGQVMMRQLIAMFDEYQSHENAKHVLRAMNENARQGFFNGSRPPLGYTTEIVEQRGARTKKRLVVDPVEAELVRLMFRLYRFGDGTSGPLGVKALTCWLNEHGYRTRLGARFGVGTVHKILSNHVYAGEWVFNRRSSKTKVQKPKAEQITIEVPPIVELAEFEAVAATLKARDPRTTAPRAVTGPILLTGLAACARCGGPMTLRTGTSKSGQVHRYYSCSTHGRQGRTGCAGRSVPMGALDDLVTGRLGVKLLQPDRLRAVLATLLASRARNAADADGRIGALRTAVAAAEDKLRRLYAMVENGIADLDDILRERLAGHRLDRDRAKAALDRIEVGAVSPADIAPALVERFGALLREQVANGETPFRRAWMRSVVDRVEVGDGAIRIVAAKPDAEPTAGAKPRKFGKNKRPAR